MSIRILYEEGQPKQYNLKHCKIFIWIPVLHKCQIQFCKHTGSFYSETKQNKQIWENALKFNSFLLFCSSQKKIPQCTAKLTIRNMLKVPNCIYTETRKALMITQNWLRANYFYVDPQTHRVPWVSTKCREDSVPNLWNERNRGDLSIFLILKYIESWFLTK